MFRVLLATALLLVALCPETEGQTPTPPAPLTPIAVNGTRIPYVCLSFLDTDARLQCFRSDPVLYANRSGLGGLSSAAPVIRTIAFNNNPFLKTDLASAQGSDYVCYGFAGTKSVCGCFDLGRYDYFELAGCATVSALDIRVTMGKTGQYACFILAAKKSSLLETNIFCVNLTTRSQFLAQTDPPQNVNNVTASTVEQNLAILLLESQDLVCYARAWLYDYSSRCYFLSNSSLATFLFTSTTAGDGLVALFLAPDEARILAIFRSKQTSRGFEGVFIGIYPVPDFASGYYFEINFTSPNPVSYISGAITSNFMFCYALSSALGYRYSECRDFAANYQWSNLFSDVSPSNSNSLVMFPDSQRYCVGFSGPTRTSISCGNVGNFSVFLTPEESPGTVYGVSLALSDDASKLVSLLTGNVSSVLFGDTTLAVNVNSTMLTPAYPILKQGKVIIGGGYDSVVRCFLGVGLLFELIHQLYRHV